MKRTYIYLTINLEDDETVGANRTIEGTAKMIKEYVEDGEKEIEVFLDEIIKVMKKHEENEDTYVLGWENELIDGIHYDTYIINPVGERILQNLSVEKVLLES